MRKVPLWIGKTDDSRPPPRVRLRIFDREGGICHLSGRKIAPGEKWQLDHKIALINGGRNSEDNLFPALVDKHAEKTKRDVAEKAHRDALAKSHAGIHPSPTMQSAPMAKTRQAAAREAARNARGPRQSLPPRRLYQ